MDQIEETTESRFFAEYDRTKADLADARLEIMLLAEQLKTANVENEKLSYKCDFLTGEVKRMADSRDQYERIAVRLVGKMDGALDAWLAMADGMKNEIRDAAFTKAPSTVTIKGEPNSVAAAVKPQPETVAVEEIGRNFGAGFNTDIPRAIKTG